MRESSLRKKQTEDGALIGVYHGWITAQTYGDTDAEYDAMRTGTALVDHSMFGRIEVRGHDRLDLLHRLSTNELNGLARGSVKATVFATDKGRILDHVCVAVREDTILLITSPGAESDLVQWIGKYTLTEDISLKVITDETTMISLIGPSADSFISSALSARLGPDSSTEGVAAGRRLFLLRRSAPQSDIIHAVTDNRDAELVALAFQGRPGSSGARWAGYRAYEGYRMSLGIAARGGELSEVFNPFEAGLRESISFTKGCYIGQEVIARLDTYKKIRRHLSGILFKEPPPEASGQTLLSGGRETGLLTSSAVEPIKGMYPGLGIIGEDAGDGSVEVTGTGTRGVLASFPMTL